MPAPKDPTKREEWLIKLSKSASAKIGWNHPKKTRERMSKSWDYDKHFPQEVKQKISEACTGEKNGFYKKKHTLQVRAIMSEKASNRTGNKNSRWKGGVSFEPYCYMFNRPFKNRVRAFFGNKCVECGKTTEKNGRALDVHHVNYDKMMCCNDVKPLFVALCHSCNSKANASRGFWEEHYTLMINEKYYGMCYLPKTSSTNLLNSMGVVSCLV